MARKKVKSKYVLFGCPKDPERRYVESGYVAFDPSNNLILVEDRERAKIYDGSIKDGKGSPRDWALMINEDYGMNVHPVRIYL